MLLMKNYSQPNLPIKESGFKKKILIYFVTRVLNFFAKSTQKKRQAGPRSQKIQWLYKKNFRNRTKSMTFERQLKAAH